MAKNTKEITMSVEMELGAVGEKLQLNLVSWNGAEAKYDLRNWYIDRNGEEKFGKGLTFTKEEMTELRDLLVSLDLD